MVLDRYTYTYDRLGNRMSRDNEVKTDGSLDEDYDYDGLYRLIDFDRADGVTQDWDLLDSLGNWADFDDDGTSQTREVNQANEITEIDSSSDNVAYDAAGNMIRVPKLDGSGDHFHLIYDAWNRLVKVYDDAGTTLIAQYQYDATGRRVVKGVDEDSDGSLDTFTHFFHSGIQVVETREGDDVSGEAPAAESLEPKYQNIWSPRYVDSMILRDEYDSQGDIITANRIYYLSDAHYNVTALVDVSGDVIERYVYTPYGTVTVLDPDFSIDADGKSDYDNTTLYTGRELDPETGLMYYRARYYDSELGRFVSRDPIGYDGGTWNLFEYSASNAVLLVDPFGLDGWVDGVADFDGSSPESMEYWWASRKYERGLRDWRQCRLNYLHEIMEEMVAVGNIIDKEGVGGLAKRDPAYSVFKPDAENCNVSLCPNGGGTVTRGEFDPQVWPKYWDVLEDAINYSLNNYDDCRYWGWADGSSMNFWGMPGITMDETAFDKDNYIYTIGLLIHEPLHDLGQYGFGHSSWKCKHTLGAIVGPSNVPEGGSYYDNFINFLRSAKCGSDDPATSIWDAIKKKVGPCKCGNKPKFSDYRNQRDPRL